jgi:hypothetical protein
MEIKKKESRKLHIMLLCLVLVFIVAATFMMYSRVSKPTPLETKEFDVLFKVSKKSIGFDLNNTLLTFGQVYPGGGAERKVVIDNQYDFPVQVDFLVSKSINGLVTSDSGFVVQPGENITVPVSLSVPEYFNETNYSGKARFELYKVG